MGKDHSMQRSNLFDGVVEGVTRSLAGKTSRRGFLGTIAKALGIGLTLPLLPVDRTGHRQAFARTAQTDDPTECTYWRYCAIDGDLCSCCGGSTSTCPPGSTPSPTSWVGSCINPGDGGTYLISYQDCCGKDACGRCTCTGMEGEMPLYRPQLNSDLLWCFGAESSMVYHCSSAVLLGRA